MRLQYEAIVTDINMYSACIIDNYTSCNMGTWAHGHMGTGNRKRPYLNSIIITRITETTRRVDPFSSEGCNRIEHS